MYYRVNDSDGKGDCPILGVICIRGVSSFERELEREFNTGLC